ncbi:MFS transporter [Nitrospira sp.]|nr:MFS transporter [Nitrospira sp.]
MNDEPSERDGRGWRLIRTKDFGLLWWGQVTSQVGEGLNKVALLWFVYELTGSAMQIAVVGLLQTIPPLLFGPIIGVYLDRLPKKAVMIWVDLIRTVMTFLIPALYALGMLSIEGLYVLIFLTAIVSTIFGPALMSAIPLLVKKTELVSGNALIQGTNNIGMLLGPAISGVLIALIGVENVLYVNSATFFLSALCLMPMHTHEVRGDVPMSSGRSSSVLGDLAVGFRFVFGDRSMVFTLVIISALYNLGASAFVFVLPVYAKELLHAGPVQLGWLWSALGAGMLAASSWLAWRRSTDVRSRLQILVSGSTVGGLAVSALSMLESTLMAGVLVTLVGAGAAVLNPVVWSLLQEVTPSHLIGRVLTTFSTGSMASAMIGMMGLGWVAETVGPAASLIGLGLILLLTAQVVIFFTRQSERAAVVVN